MGSKHIQSSKVITSVPSEIKFNVFTTFAKALVHNVLFDYGFRVYTSRANLKVNSKLCSCPIAIAGKRWRYIYGLDGIFDYCTSCDHVGYLTPNAFMDHIRGKAKTCYFHAIIDNYLTSVYDNWWVGDVSQKNHATSHYGLHPIQSRYYNTSMMSFENFGRNNPKMRHVEKERPTILYKQLEKDCMIKSSMNATPQVKHSETNT